MWISIAVSITLVVLVVTRWGMSTLKALGKYKEQASSVIKMEKAKQKRRTRSHAERNKSNRDWINRVK